MKKTLVLIVSILTYVGFGYAGGLPPCGPGDVIIGVSSIGSSSCNANNGSISGLVLGGTCQLEITVTSPNDPNFPQTFEFDVAAPITPFGVGNLMANGVYFIEFFGSQIGPFTVGERSPTITSIVTTNPTCPGAANGQIRVEAQRHPLSSATSLDYVVNGQTEILPDDKFALFSNLPAGLYPVLVRDNTTGCETTNFATLTDPSKPTSLSIATTSTTCSDSSDGQISVLSVNGGVPPYQGCLVDTTNPSFPTTCITVPGTFTNLPPSNTYKVTVTDVCGNPFSNGSIVVGTPSQLMLSITSTDTSCAEDNGTISIISVSGGTAPYTINLTGPVNGSTILPGGNTTFTNLPQGMYAVSIIDTNGCTIAPLDVFIAGSTGTVAITDIQLKHPTCPNNSNGFIRVSAESTVDELTYVLTGPENQEIVSDKGTVKFKILPSGIYTVTVINEANVPPCSASIEINLTVEPIVFDTPSVQPVCNGNDGSIRLAASQVSGGTPPYRYSIGGRFKAVGQSFKNLAAGTYMVVVKDANGCESDPLEVEVPVDPNC